MNFCHPDEGGNWVKFLNNLLDTINQFPPSSG
jgi:hypothetical protein